MGYPKIHWFTAFHLGGPHHLRLQIVPHQCIGHLFTKQSNKMWDFPAAIAADCEGCGLHLAKTSKIKYTSVHMGMGQYLLIPFLGE